MKTRKILSLLLAFLFYTTNVLASGMSGGGTPNDDSVTSAKILDGTIVSVDIKDNTIASAKLLDNTVATGKIADGTIVAADIADNTINVEKLKAASGTPSATTYYRGDNTWATPAGTGDVVGPASATDGYFALWDNTTGKLLKDGFSSVNPAFSTINVTGANALNLGTGSSIAGSVRFKNATNAFYFQILGGVSGADIGWTTPTAAPGGANYLLNVDADGAMDYTDPATFAVSGHNHDAAYQAIEDQGLSTTDAPTFVSVTAGEFISTALDNTRGWTAQNTANPTGANLTAGKCWTLKGATSATDTLVCNNSDNTALNTMGAVVKQYSFGIDNVVDGDDIFVWMDLARAITITKVTCFASTDNVIGVLSECTAADLTSCTAVDDTDWTIGADTAATVATSFDSGFENAGIAAGTHLKWITTSEGTSNSNKLSCTIQYRE